MSKLSKEDININGRLGYLEDALNEIYERLAALERADLAALKRAAKKKKVGK